MATCKQCAKIGGWVNLQMKTDTLCFDTEIQTLFSGTFTIMTLCNFTNVNNSIFQVLQLGICQPLFFFNLITQTCDSCIFNNKKNCQLCKFTRGCQCFSCIICQRSFLNIEGQCLRCPFPAVYDFMAESCQCGLLQLFDMKSFECIACKENQSGCLKCEQAEGCECTKCGACQEGMILEKGSCSSCLITFVNSNGKCVCPEFFEQVGEACVLKGLYQVAELMQLKEVQGAIKQRSEVAGSVMGVILMLGLASLIGELLIKTSLLKVHLWFIGYTPLTVINVLYVVSGLEDNNVVVPLQNYTRSFVHTNVFQNSSQNAFTQEYFDFGNNLLINGLPLGIEISTIIIKILLICTIRLLFIHKRIFMKKNIIKSIKSLIQASRIELILIVVIQISTADFDSLTTMSISVLLGGIVIVSTFNVIRRHKYVSFKRLIIIISVEMRYLVIPCTYLLGYDRLQQTAPNIIINSFILILVVVNFCHSINYRLVIVFIESVIFLTLEIFQLLSSFFSLPKVIDYFMLGLIAFLLFVYIILFIKEIKRTAVKLAKTIYQKLCKTRRKKNRSSIQYRTVIGATHIFLRGNPLKKKTSIY